MSAPCAPQTPVRSGGVRLDGDGKCGAQHRQETPRPRLIQDRYRRKVGVAESASSTFLTPDCTSDGQFALKGPFRSTCERVLMWAEAMDPPAKGRGLEGKLRVGLHGQRRSPTRDKCGYRRADGSTCKNPAGFSTDHLGYGMCKRHGGTSANHRKHALKLLAADQAERARVAVATLGLARDVGPLEALIEEVQRTAGHVEWLGGRLACLDANTLAGGPTGTGSHIGVELAALSKEAAWPLPTVPQPADGTFASWWIQLYQRERAHLVRVCSTAVLCGAAERQIHIAKAQGRLIARVLLGVLSDLGVAHEAHEVRAAVRRNLALVSAAAAARVSVERGFRKDRARPGKRNGERHGTSPI